MKPDEHSAAALRFVTRKRYCHIKFREAERYSCLNDWPPIEIDKKPAMVTPKQAKRRDQNKWRTIEGFK